MMRNVWSKMIAIILLLAVIGLPMANSAMAQVAVGPFNPEALTSHQKEMPFGVFMDVSLGSGSEGTVNQDVPQLLDEEGVPSNTFILKAQAVGPDNCYTFTWDNQYSGELQSWDQISWASAPTGGKAYADWERDGSSIQLLIPSGYGTPITAPTLSWWRFSLDGPLPGTIFGVETIVNNRPTGLGWWQLSEHHTVAPTYHQVESNSLAIQGVMLHLINPGVRIGWDEFRIFQCYESNPSPRPCPTGGCKNHLPLVSKQNQVLCHPGWWGYWSTIVETFPQLAGRTNIPETSLITGNSALGGFINIGDPVCLPSDPEQAWFEENGLTALFDQPRSFFLLSNLALVALDGPLPFGDAVVVGRLASNGAQVARIVRKAIPLVGVTVIGWLGLRNIPPNTPVVVSSQVHPMNQALGRFNQTTVTKLSSFSLAGRYFILPWNGGTIPEDAVEAIWIERPQSSLVSRGFVLIPNWEQGVIFPQSMPPEYLHDYAIVRGNGHIDDTNSGIGRPEMRRADAAQIAAIGMTNPIQCWKKRPEPGRWGSARALVYQTATGVITFLHNLDVNDRTFLRGNIPQDDLEEYDTDWRMVTASQWEPCDPFERNLVLLVLDEVLDYLGIPHSPVGQTNKPE